MKIAALPVATAFLLLAFCIPIDRASAEEEFLKWDLDQREWKFGHQSKLGNQTIMEFVRPNETINSWSELMTVQVFSEPPSSMPIDELVSKTHQEISKRCPKMVWNVINRQFSSDTEKDGIMYEWSIKDCPPDADQHEIARVVYGRFSTVRLAYTAKTGDLASDKREKWIKELSEARLLRERPKASARDSSAPGQPVVLEDVWYRTEEAQLLIAYKEAGTLEIAADKFVFTYSGGKVEIPVSAVQRITPRKRFTFFDANEWVMLDYRFGDKDLVAAFKPALLTSKTSYDQILKAINSTLANR